MIFNTTNLKPSVNVKYLGFKLNETLCDGDDILKELRALYIRSNAVIRTFSKCSNFLNHIVHLYILFSFIYNACYNTVYIYYKKSTYSKIRVAYSNVFMKLLKLP